MVFEQLNILYSRLNTLAPNLAPQPAPRKCGYGSEFLLSFCKTHDQKSKMNQMIDKYIQKKHNNEKSRCNMVVLAEFNTHSKKFEIKGLNLLSDNEYNIHSFQKFLELYVNARTEHDREEVKDLVKCFLQKNSHKESHEIVVDECMAIAYSIQTILRAFPSIKYSLGDTSLESIDTDTDIEFIFGDLFCDKSEKNKSVKKNIKKTKQTITKKRSRME